MRKEKGIVRLGVLSLLPVLLTAWMVYSNWYWESIAFVRGANGVCFLAADGRLQIKSIVGSKQLLNQLPTGNGFFNFFNGGLQFSHLDQRWARAMRGVGLDPMILEAPSHDLKLLALGSMHYHVRGAYTGPPPSGPEAHDYFVQFPLWPWTFITSLLAARQWWLFVKTRASHSFPVLVNQPELDKS